MKAKSRNDPRAWNTTEAQMSIAFLFPGQGSQVPGMLHALPDHPAVTQTLDEMSTCLNTDIREFDSEDAQRSSASVQLSLLACGVSMARVLIEDGVEPEAVAGLSVGAFAAATLCGVISLSDAVRLVRQRAEMMVHLYPTGYGLAAIVGLNEKQVSRLVEEAYTELAPVYVGNINAPRQIVIAGSDEGIRKVLEAARKNGARKAEELHVSVASHCPLLEPVAVALRESLKKMQLQSPAYAYVGNVNARTLRTSDAIAEDLASNVSHGVRWYDSVTVLEELGCHIFLEMPPGHVLTQLAKETVPSVQALALGETSLKHALHVFTRYSNPQRF
jgi:malonate decarboxylase epsilon subunit